MRQVKIIDIETRKFANANEALEPFLDNITTRNKVDAMKVATEKAEKREKMISKAALTPLASEVIAIGIGHATLRDEADMPTLIDHCEVEILMMENGNEADLIRRFKKIAETGNEFVTFNGREFDFPYLMFRAAIYGIPLNLPAYHKNTFDGHFDLAQHLVKLSLISNLDSSTWYVSLAKWLRYFGLPAKNLRGAEEIAKAFEENQEEFKEYLTGDITNTWELLKRFHPHFERRFSR